MEQSSTVVKRLCHIVRVVYYMIRKGFTKHKLTMELNLLLKRGKIARKALGNLITFHHHNHASSREVEFSCSNTPSFPSFHAIKRKNHSRRHDYEFDAAMVAKAFEILNSEISDAESSVMPSPSATPLWNIYWKSPVAAARQLRITDSPFPVREEEEEDVDMKAEEFIRKFYGDLQLQQRIPQTPNNWYRRREAITSRA